MYKLLVADDEDLDRKLVRLMLEGNTQFEIIGKGRTCGCEPGKGVGTGSNSDGYQDA